jgi:purine-binding chemotaxis protein CheW
MSTRQFCSFRLEPYEFGIDVMAVRDVLRHGEFTRVPRAAAMVRGLMNLRGQVLTALDLRIRLGLPERPSNRPPLNIVVETADGLVSLIVDEVGDVLTLDDADRETTPDTVRGPARAVTSSVYKRDKGLLLELDVDRAVQVGTDAR